ncbi:MerR family transcriptional regulator [Desulfofarcimen acetoxidans]|uniref:MerR family transcriptional regulator n=1 Tax=Desulfofarcimen acetoxidans TaxID=58138 RepID=UPI00019E5805|nr:MerR family transcriptional regulator [Desulfofarcimen acetoxidans]
MDKKYKPNEFAELINMSVKTLQRWDYEGILKAYRTPTDRRYYTHEQYLSYIGESSKEGNRGKVIMIVVNNESLSPQEEMIQDLISIINVFSCRIYGLRKYKSKIRDELKQ